MTAYRQVLAVPGMPPLLGITLVARTAITADIMVLTLYVVLGLHLSYAAAGGVAAALTAGVALGGPPLGRTIDRRGLRPVLLATAAVQAAFWVAVPVLPYPVLLPAALVAGLLMVPVQSVTRQAITALTPPPLRRPAFALESVQGELSYLIGPAVVIVGAAHTSPGVMAWAAGAVITGGGIALALLDPPVRTAGEQTAAGPPRRRWLTARLVAVLIMAVGVTTLLSGVDLAVVATLTEAGQTSRAAGVVVVLGLASVTGGLIYGSLSRPLPTWVLLALLGAVTVPAGLARTWPWLCLAAAGIGLLTAPTLATVADAVSALAPAGARGEATGMQSSAQSAGFALGSPLTGAAIDATTPAGGFAVAGLAGVLAAVTGHLLSRRRNPAPAGFEAAPARVDPSADDRTRRTA